MPPIRVTFVGDMAQLEAAAAKGGMVLSGMVEA
jgi:hypothetical protein